MSVFKASYSARSASYFRRKRLAALCDRLAIALFHRILLNRSR